MKTLFKTLSLLTLPLAIASCDDNVRQNTEIRTEANSMSQVTQIPTPQPTPTQIQYSFNDLREIPILNDNIACRVIAADIDGDGDQDLIVSYYEYYHMKSGGETKLRIYENKIPQHNQSQTSKTAESYK